MLFGSLFVFTMVALMGLSMVGDAWKTQPQGGPYQPRRSCRRLLFAPR